MRTLVSCLVVVMLGGGTAFAQPGQTPVAPQPPQPYPVPPTQPYVPPPYTYQPQLSAEDQKLLQDGEISDGEYIGGGIASLFLGFGIGQAIQGRWTDKGWIFTVGETASFAVLIYGISKQDCFLTFWDSCSQVDDGDDGEGAIVAGMLGLVVFRVWEIFDAFAVPPAHNRRLRDLRLRLGYPPPQPYYGQRLTPFIVPPRDASGAIAGVTMRF